jgi:hypothetical protein
MPPSISQGRNRAIDQPQLHERSKAGRQMVVIGPWPALAGEEKEVRKLPGQGRGLFVDGLASGPWTNGRIGEVPHCGDAMLELGMLERCAECLRNVLHICHGRICRAAWLRWEPDIEPLRYRYTSSAGEPLAPEVDDT